MMNRLEAPHGVLSRFFRARSLRGCTQTEVLRRVREGRLPAGVLDYAEHKANTHVYTYVRIATPGSGAYSVIKKFEVNKHT